jgi:hypothetical protein
MEFCPPNMESPLPNIDSFTVSNYIEFIDAFFDPRNISIAIESTNNTISKSKTFVVGKVLNLHHLVVGPLRLRNPEFIKVYLFELIVLISWNHNHCKGTT